MSSQNPLYVSQGDPSITADTIDEVKTLREENPDDPNYAIWEVKTILDLTDYPE